MAMPQPGVYQEYLGWNYRWTGWKGSYDEKPSESLPGEAAYERLGDTLTGQWCAYRGPSMIYVSVPGGEGLVPRGSLLDIQPREGQVVVRDSLEESVKERMREEAHERLLELIRAECLVEA